MNFNTLAFLIFLPVVVLVYWLLPHKGRKYWLLAASYFFYMYWNPALIVLLLASTTVDYLCGRGMERWADNKRAKTALLIVSITVNLGLLFFFKYWDFFAENVDRLCAALSIPYSVPTLNLILPVGISFYTFQTMSYTIDVYRGDHKTERNFITFALYVTFFPQLVAGPIETPGNLLPQLKTEHRFSRDDLRAGCRLLISGFFRKCAVADVCGILVNAVFKNAESANGPAILFACALFCFQMYCDFAGYSEIAAGAARIMGIRLMQNFDRPYLAQSYGEFFRRWHISLNRWFTSYVYIPLGGGRKGLARKMLNTVIVFTLCGLWHGARWTYVLWGLYAAFWVCIESLVLKKLESAAERRGIDLKNPLVVRFRRLYMFIIFLPAALLFRAESLSQAGTLFSRVFTTGFSIGEALSLMGANSFTLIHIGLALLAMSRLPAFAFGDIPPASAREERIRRTAVAAYYVVMIAFCWIALLRTHDAAGFAYFQF